MLNKRNIVILKIIALIFVILFIKNKMSTEHFIKETIQSIVENEDADNIEVPKDFINAIESIYTFTEKYGYDKPSFRLGTKNPVKIKDKIYYSIHFLAFKYANDGTQVDYKYLSILIEVERSLTKLKIINYKILGNNLKE